MTVENILDLYAGTIGVCPIGKDDVYVYDGYATWICRGYNDERMPHSQVSNAYVNDIEIIRYGITNVLVLHIR